MRTQLTVHQLIIFFGVTGCAQGMSGLLTQPVTHYLKSFGFGADEVVQGLALAAIPWAVKPIYGLLTDFVPLFGYHRKSYLLMTVTITILGYVCLTQAIVPDAVIAILLLTTFGLAASDVVVDALLVEHGQRTEQVQVFQGHQWAWLNLSAIASGFLGGWLASRYEPEVALHGAALFLMVAPVAVFIVATVLLRERKVGHETIIRAGTAGQALRQAFTSRHSCTAAVLLMFWNLAPRFTTPLYYHMTDHLLFDQYFLGQLNAIGAAGAVVGAFIYKHCLAGRWPLSKLLYIGIWLGFATTLGHLALVDASTAVTLYFFGGIFNMISLLTLFSLAASVCPPQAAAFSFATLMALYSAAGQLASLVGGHLFVHLLNEQIAPLIWLASGHTLATLLLVPLLSRRQPALITHRANEGIETAVPDRSRVGENQPNSYASVPSH